MKTKNTIVLLVLLFITFSVNANSDETSVSSTSTNNTEKVAVEDTYSNYLNTFITEFKSELSLGKSTRIDEKIKSLTSDIEYINKHIQADNDKNAEIYKKLELYQLKLKVLKQIRAQYLNTTISNEEENEKNSVNREAFEKEKAMKYEKEKALKAIEEKKKLTNDEIKNKFEVKKNDKEKNNQKKLELIKKHKQNFTHKLENTLDKLSNEQIGKAIDRVNLLIQKSEGKENMLNQLTALKQLMEDKLSATEELDIESIFKDL